MALKDTGLQNVTINAFTVSVFIIAHLSSLTLCQQISNEGVVTRYRLTTPVGDRNGSFVFAEFNINKESSEAVTACVWMRVLYFRRPSVVLGLGSMGDLNDVSLGVVPMGITLRQGLVVIMKQVKIMPLSWHHFCLTVTPTFVSVALNGRWILNADAQHRYFNGQPRVMVGGGIIWPDLQPTTYQLSNVKDKAWDELIDRKILSAIGGSFAGDLQNPVVWNSVLREEELDLVSKCQIKQWLQPLKIIWVKQGSNIFEENKNGSEPCYRQSFDYVLFPEKMNYVETFRLCEKMELGMIKPINALENDLVYRDALKHQEKCERGRKILWLWSTKKNTCPGLTSSGQESSDCKMKLCGGCQLRHVNRRKYMILRGLCPVNEYDFAFVITQKENNELNNLGEAPQQHYYQGVERYNIIPITKDQWDLVDTSDNTVIATLNNTDAIGINTWVILKVLCGYNIGEEVLLSLSSCNNNETPCRSGICVPLAQRCDGYPNCPDGADEENCHAVRPPPDYLPGAPPPPPPVNIILSMELVRLVSFEPLTLLLRTSLVWIDPRVKFANIRSGEESPLTPLPLEHELWQPRLVALAPQSSAPLDAVRTDLNKFDKLTSTSLTAFTTTTPHQDTREMYIIDKLYGGANTTLTLSEYLVQPMACDFDLSFYPFDEHRCELSLALLPHSVDHARLIIQQNAARYTGPAYLSDFTLEDTSLELRHKFISGRTHSSATFRIRLRRRPAFGVLTVFLPSMLLLLLSNAALWMPSTGAPSRIILSCTVTGTFFLMWVLACVKTPSTAHAKVIDVWLSFCTTHSILIMMLHIFLDVFTDNSSTNHDERRSITPDINRFTNPSIKIKDHAVREMIRSTVAAMSGTSSLTHKRITLPPDICSPSPQPPPPLPSTPVLDITDYSPMTQLTQPILTPVEDPGELFKSVADHVSGVLRALPSNTTSNNVINKGVVRNVKPMTHSINSLETPRHSVYDLLPPFGEDEWSPQFWITFIARVVSPVLVVIFNIAFWPFVFYFRGID